MKILIKKLSNVEFQVTVKGNKTTNHIVIVNDDIYKKLTYKKVNKKQLIEFSFKFLLERESNTSILSSFELIIISDYFPEFNMTVEKWISSL
tara:strand:+ start:639 stop:914 length:276 start_codon:yes stop_codon:yes gene_type:complete